MAKLHVAALIEYCEFKNIPPPTYTLYPNEYNGFICKVEILGMQAFGNDQLEHKAKYLSALNMIKKIRAECDQPTVREMQSFLIAKLFGELGSTSTSTSNSNLSKLRDFCVLHEMPLPYIDMVQESGEPENKKFVYECRVASIKRFGTADNKEDARENAVLEMFKVLNIMHNKDRGASSSPVCGASSSSACGASSSSGYGASSNSACGNLADLENERRLRFKTYRDLKDAGKEKKYGVKICDRHYYFKNYFPHLKEAAFKVLKSDEYESKKDQAMAVIKALKLEAKVTELDSTATEPLLFIELNAELDCVFLGLESNIYESILSYFQSMLD